MRPTYLNVIPETARLLQTSNYEIRWNDMDAFSHVNNATYFVYFEQVRIDWVRSLGLEHELVLANVGCTFIRPIVYPANIEVLLYGANPGKSSMDTYYEIRDAADPRTCYTLGHGVLIWYNHDSGQAVELPPEVRGLLAE